MFWIYRIATVERLKLQNEMLAQEVRSLRERLGRTLNIEELFTDTEDPQGDREFEEVKKRKDNRIEYDDFAGDRNG